MFSIFLCLTWVHSNSSWVAVNWNLCRKLFRPQDQRYTWWSDMHILEIYELLSYDRSWGTMVNLHNNKPASRPENNWTSWCRPKPCHLFCTCLPFGLRVFAMWFHMFYTCLHLFYTCLPCDYHVMFVTWLPYVCQVFATCLPFCLPYARHVFATCFPRVCHNGTIWLWEQWRHMVKYIIC